jgi:hypothetical protein
LVAADGTERPSPAPGSLLTLIGYVGELDDINKLRLQDSDLEEWELGRQAVQHWSVIEGVQAPIYTTYTSS